MKLKCPIAKTLISRLSLLAALVLAHPAWSVPQLKLESQFNNDNWFPLEKEIMEDAVVDSAVSQLSEDVDFLLLSPDNPAVGSAVDLTIVTTLIEPAQEVKVLIRTTMGDRTRQSEAVVPVETADYASLFRSFTVAGRRAARKLAVQFNESLESPELDSNDIEVQKLLNQVAQLKRKEKFEQSYAALRLLLKSGKLSEELKASVQEELYYKLPLFQAQHLMVPERQMRTRESIERYYGFIESILKKALERNLDSPEKQLKLNSQLDIVYQTREQYLRVVQYRGMKQLVGLRTEWHERYLMMGEFITEDLVRGAERNNVDLTVSDYQSDGDSVTARLQTGPGFEYQVSISLSPWSVDIEPIE